MASKESIEQEIAYHLKNNDPESAKNVYDQWMMKKNVQSVENKETITTSDYKDLAALF